MYWIDSKNDEFESRFLLDIKGSSILVYFYILKDGTFLNPNLGHLGFALNNFDLTNIKFEGDFGFETKCSTTNY